MLVKGATGKFEWNFRYVIFQQILVIDGWGISREIALIWMSLDSTNDQSTLVQVLAWCRQAQSHYLSQCWPRSLSLYGVTRPQWVNFHSISRYVNVSIHAPTHQFSYLGRGLTCPACCRCARSARFSTSLPSHICSASGWHNAALSSINLRTFGANAARFPWTTFKQRTLVWLAESWPDNSRLCLQRKKEIMFNTAEPLWKDHQSEWS